ncbi:MAG: FCD domain-containing protein [Rhodobiaceae bacterium]|nr:FCD domain-containing protein [Rhodobiaceae bacterium]
MPRRSAARAADHRSGRAAVENGDLPDMVAHDVSFHEFIYEICGNSADRHDGGIALALSAPRHGGSVALRAARSAIWQQHEDILEAILDGDAEVPGHVPASTCSTPRTGSRVPSSRIRKDMTGASHHERPADPRADAERTGPPEPRQNRCTRP